MHGQPHIKFTRQSSRSSRILYVYKHVSVGQSVCLSDLTRKKRYANTPNIGTSAVSYGQPCFISSTAAQTVRGFTSSIRWNGRTQWRHTQTHMPQAGFETSTSQTRTANTITFGSLITGFCLSCCHLSVHSKIRTRMLRLVENNGTTNWILPRLIEMEIPKTNFTYRLTVHRCKHLL